MRIYLERRSTVEDAVPRILERLKQARFLDDKRSASQFVRMRTEIRRQGRFRIARDLRARGIADPDIDAAFEEQTGHTDEGAMVRAHILRLLKTLRVPLDERRVASLYRGLLRSGFSSETVRREIKDVARISMDEVPDDPSGDT